MKQTTVALALAALLLAGCSGEKTKANGQESQAAEQTATTNQGGGEAASEAGLMPADRAQQAPGFTLMSVEGGEVSLSDYEGQVVLLDFWDTWCPPCRRSIPDLIKLQETYGDRGFTVLGIAFGNEGRQKVVDFAEEYEINYPVVVMGQDRALARQYGGIQSIPTMFMVDREGRVRAMHVGYRGKELFVRQIEALL